MNSLPRLLNTKDTILLRRELFADLQINKILSEQAISVLQQPCGKNEIVRRTELFGLLESSEYLNRIETVLSALSDAERSLHLLQEEKIPLYRYYRYGEVFEFYVDACEHLMSMSDLGSLFADTANYFAFEEKQSKLAELKESAQKIKNLLERLHTGLLSFADKNWLTPDCEAVSEIDHIAECAEKLGFTAPQKKKHNTKIDLSLSDAICRLYADEVSEIEAQIAKFADVNFFEPLAYISEIKFFLEIHDLIQKANKLGVPHCIPKIANKPRYTANELYDISLLAKNCEDIIPNDADFSEKEPFCFLLGANGGGKTTYLRAVGINLIFFLAGCPVFAKEAEIFPFDIVLSHFPKDERFDNIGRLDEERKRTEEILTEAKGKTAFLLFNEAFSGTDDKRGFELLSDTAARVKESKHFGLYVTHFHEVISLDCPVLSAEVDPADENRRTFRIVRSKGSASSYAADILKKYRLDKNSLAARRCENGN